MYCKTYDGNNILYTVRLKGRTLCVVRIARSRYELCRVQVAFSKQETNIHESLKVLFCSRI